MAFATKQSIEKNTMKIDPQCFHGNPLTQEDRQDTLLNAAAVIHCLQHIKLETGLDDEGEYGMNLILETVPGALRFETIERQ